MKGTQGVGELGQVQKRVLDSTTGFFLFRITSEGREFLLQKGTDQRYGARNLERAIERYVVSPLARLLATAQVQSGDVLLIDRHPGEKGLAFLKDREQRSPMHRCLLWRRIPSTLRLRKFEDKRMSSPRPREFFSSP